MLSLTQGKSNVIHGGGGGCNVLLMGQIQRCRQQKGTPMVSSTDGKAYVVSNG